MIVFVEKKLRVSYSAAVHNCVRRLRVLPHATNAEIWRAWPEPDATREFTDDFGNRVLELRHDKIEDEFLLELSFQFQPQNITNVLLPKTGIGAFLLPSALCDLGEIIQEIAKEFNSASHDLPAQICEWTYGALRYDASISGIETTASQSLERGAGVCQDFAHLMIALCRARALPARYISGYAPGEGRMHAWVEVFIENQWQAFDPTHNREVQDDSVPVAIGRDFRDVNPHEGTFRGRAIATLESGCRVHIEK